MELWRVRKEYRALAVRLRQRKQAVSREVDLAEARVLELMLLLERTESELSVLRMARRCARARLGRVRRWVEGAGLMKSLPRSLARQPLELAVEGLAQALERAQYSAGPLKQVLHEVTVVEQRHDEVSVRLRNLTASAHPTYQLLVHQLRAEGLDPAASWAPRTPRLRSPRLNHPAAAVSAAAHDVAARL